MRAIDHAELLYPLDYLRAQHRAGYVVYPRTDSHWTSLGALCAFQWIIRHFNTVVDYAPFLDTTPIPMSYRGDLWGDGYDAMPPDLLERRAVPPGIRRITANPIVRLKERERIENEADLHLGSHVAYVNDSAERPERVVLFGSSFSEYRAECSLLTFLATLFYREVHFVWSSSLDFGFIRRIKANLVIVEMPERFLTVSPSDTFDLADHEARVVATWESRHATATAGA
jgi:hypothetical protein